MYITSTTNDLVDIKVYCISERNTKMEITHTILTIKVQF